MKETKPTLLIVDDDEEIRTQMKWALAKDYEIVTAGDRSQALEMFLSSKPVVTLLDLGLPPSINDPTEGLAALSEMSEADDSAKIIIISGQGERENAIRAIGMGAYDFISKPVDMDELKLVLRRCFYVSELENEVQELREDSSAKVFEGMIAGSPEMHGQFKMIRKVAKSDAPVLILGESGTGKEMVANAIHRQSSLSDGPFVAINCNAIPENLIESELFSHEKGTFTNADSQRKGLIEGAEGGTLFLDEIGELPLSVQVKLLRFLQEKRLQRVGGRTELKIDARVVAATNANLEEAVSQGSFREDLYYRLAVVVLRLPPLRERGNDVSVLAQTFLQQFAEESGKKTLSFAKEAIRAIIRHPWPGNVRELKNRVQRAVIMAEGKRIGGDDLELKMEEEQTKVTLKVARENLEREMVQKALRSHAGTITAAAAELGISRPTFYELMDRLDIPRGS